MKYDELGIYATDSTRFPVVHVYNVCSNGTAHGAAFENGQCLTSWWNTETGRSTLPGAINNPLSNVTLLHRIGPLTSSQFEEIELLRIRIKQLEAEKANLVERNSILRCRPDLPIARLNYEKAIARLAALEDGR